MERITLIDRVKYEVLLESRREGKILHTLKRGTVNWIGHFLPRNCFLKRLTKEKMEGKMAVTRRRGRKCEQLLDNLKEKRRYWKFKKETLDHTVWRTRFGIGSRPVVRH
jgi:hypothetical protein